MARTNLPITNMTANGGIAQPAGTAIDQANGMNVALASTAVPATGGSESLFFQVTNSGTTGNFILRAGVLPPAWRKDLGDLTVSVANGATKIIGPFDSGRFMQSDGSLNVDFAAAFAGTIAAYLMPVKFD